MTEEKNSNLLSLILISALLMISCNSNIVFTDSFSMEDNVWRLTSIPVYNVTVTDTASANDIFFSVRTGSSYPFRNIFLFVTTTSPDGKSITDTLEYQLADEKGRWLGKGLGDINELRLPYKTNIFFPVTGTYRIRVQHGMRAEDLKGVYDFSLRVEKRARQ